MYYEYRLIVRNVINIVYIYIISTKNYLFCDMQGIFMSVSGHQGAIMEDRNGRAELCTTSWASFKQQADGHWPSF